MHTRNSSQHKKQISIKATHLHTARTSIRRQREHMWVCELLPDKHKKGEPRNRYSFSISAFLFFYHSPFPVPCLSEQNHYHYHYHGIRSCSNLPTHPRLILSSLRLLLLPFASLPTHSAECRTCQKRKKKSSLYHVKCTLFPSIFPYSVLFCSVRVYMYIP